VFSEFGQNFLKTMLKLAKTKTQLSIVSDQVGGPTYAPDIARTILLIASESQKKKINNVYHFSGRPYVSWYQFAKEIFKQANVNIELKTISSSEFPTKAKRPRFSKLDCSRLQNLSCELRTNWNLGISRSLEHLS
jgi:dTDP-4-dehydrorhamnose reductase